jgi:hypothetical protein
MSSLAAVPLGIQLARGLGWFSIVLGVTELFFPKQFGRAIGGGDRRMLLRALGLREIASGIAILARQRPSANVPRARVAGDAIDQALPLQAADGGGRNRDDRQSAGDCIKIVPKPHGNGVQA